MKRLGAFVAVFLGFLSPALAGPQDVKLTDVRQDDKEFTLKSAAGRYVAVHFLPHPDKLDAAWAREYSEKTPTMAGVRHVFVSANKDSLKSWAKPLTDPDLMIADDPDEKLAAECKLQDTLAKGHPATIVFDPEGNELFRRDGVVEGPLVFTEFARLLSQKWRANTGEYNLPKGKSLALEGYDPVSYFSGMPAKGDAKLTSEYRGVTYQFSSPENRRAFARNPEAYLPTYGGWCATAMGKNGEKVEIDPTNFEVTRGRLFLFYKSILANAKKDWDKHEKEWEPAADKAWKKFSGEDPIKPTPRGP